MPFIGRLALSSVIACFVYFPVARIGALLDRAGLLPANWPLAFYRDKSFYSMRTDALDRFGTRFEQRFTRAQIESLLRSAGFVDISFGNDAPYWCAVGFKGSERLEV